MDRKGRIALFVVWAILWIGAPPPVGAEEKAGGPFRVVDVALHAEAPKAEICLSFSEPIQPKDRERILEAVSLRKDGTREKLSAKDLSLAPAVLCVQNLEHRSRYDFLLRKFQGPSGEKLARPYSAVFTVPDRKPFLAFVSDSDLSVLPRHVKAKDGKERDPLRGGMAHVLRSVNVESVRLTLYRVPNRDSFARAWHQFTLLNLSPLESLVFAKAKGQAVFESDLVFGPNPNVEQTLLAPLPPDKALEPGLYYLAAEPKTPTGGKAKLFAGQWFLVSDLRLTALRLPGGLEVFAGDLEERKPAASVEVQLLSLGGKVLAESRTKPDGSAFLPFPKDREEEAFLLTGRGASGDVDILGIGNEKTVGLGAPLARAFVRPDRQAYRPGSMAAVALRAEDGEGRSAEIKNSSLKLLRPDRRVYSQQIAPAEKAGTLLMNVPLPFVREAGVWFLSWQREDGGVIAEAPLLLAPQAQKARLEMRLVREGETDGASLRLQIKATDDRGEPLAFRAGKVVARGTRPEVPRSESYRFGVFVPDDPGKESEVSFMTGPDGRASLDVPFDRRGMWDALELSASLRQEGAFASLTVPLPRTTFLVGVRPLATGAAFAENGMARFEIIAVDPAGKRRAEKNLYYLIYEEGRNFEWFPAEGYWDYRPLPKHRRVAGGPLSIGASEETILTWPVTTGQYALEILNADGLVLARQPFEAGRVAASVKSEEDGRFRFLSAPPKLEERKENLIRFYLESPAFVSAMVFDGRVRAVLHRFMPAGENVLPLAPTKEWGRQVLVRLRAAFLDSPVPAQFEKTIEVDKPRQELALSAAPPSGLVSGAGVSIPVKVQKIQGKKQTYLSVISTPLSSDGKTNFPVVRLDRVPVDALGRAKIDVNVPLFDGELRLTVMAWNDDQYGEKSFTIPARPALGLTAFPPERLESGDKVEVSFTVENNKAQGEAYAYELQIPPGLTAQEPLKGNIRLAKGESRALTFLLTAREPGEGALRFEIAGSGGARAAQSWPLTVVPSGIAGESGAFSATKAKVGLLSPVKMPFALRALRKLASDPPHTLEEIGLWLEASRSWEEPLKNWGLIGETRLEALRRAFLREIQSRQNGDGGFSAVGTDEASDMASTVAAMNALRDKAERPFALAAQWLGDKLNNAWFEESEREARIEAVEALSRTKRADLSVLRYLSQTSRDKKLSPWIAASLGLALELNGESEASFYWTKRAEESLPRLATESPVGFWKILATLAENDKVKPEFLRASLAYAPPLEASASLKEAALRLIALARVASRFGPWTANLDGAEIKAAGFLAVSPEGRTEGRVLSSDQEVRFLEGEALAGEAKDDPSFDREPVVSLQRTFFKPDGAAFDFDLSLMKGEPYLLILKGAIKEDEPRPLRLVLPPCAGLEVTVPEDNDAFRAHFPWLPKDLARIEKVSDLPMGRVLAFAPEKVTWQIALLVRPVRKGSFALPRARVLSATGEDVPAEQNDIRFSIW